MFIIMYVIPNHEYVTLSCYLTYNKIFCKVILLFLTIFYFIWNTQRHPAERDIVAI